MKVVFFSFRTLLRLMVLALFCLPGFAGQVEAGENVVSTIQNSGTKSTLLGTFFVSAQHGWAVGAGGTVLKTEDAGATWQAVTRRTAALLTSIYFTDAHHGWIVGQNGTILHTNDHGENVAPPGCRSWCRTL